jgi:hypothetical protein
VARETSDFIQCGPDRGIQLLEPEVSGNEAVAPVNADGHANECAIHFDDVRLQHRLVLRNDASEGATDAPATTLTRQLHRDVPDARWVRVAVRPVMAILSSPVGGIAQVIREHSFLYVQYAAEKKIILLHYP